MEGKEGGDEVALGGEGRGGGEEEEKLRGLSEINKLMIMRMINRN